MIKLIIFDLDGTLVSSKSLHFDALNLALQEISPNHVISHADQNTIFEGLPTATKLRILVDQFGLDQSLCSAISRRKQEITLDLLATTKFDVDHKPMLTRLKKEGFLLAVCTNTIPSTAKLILENLQILSLFDGIFCNDCVVNPKPSPDIFRFAMEVLKILPEHTVVFEDSDHGLTAARESGASVGVVTEPKKLHYRSVKSVVSAHNLLYNLTDVERSFIRNFVWGKRGQTYLSHLICVDCTSSRTITLNDIVRQIRRDKFTGRCKKCSRSHLNFKDGQHHPLYNPEKRTTQGYKLVNSCELSDKERELFKGMMQRAGGGKTNYVLEHRLIMARKLGRPLNKHEIVHHLNGKRDDNSLENLELLTTSSDHHSGHGDFYYQKWQEAEARIKELEFLLENK